MTDWTNDDFEVEVQCEEVFVEDPIDDEDFYRDWSELLATLD